MKVNPKLKDMTEKERKAWEKEWRNIESNNIRKDAFNKIQGYRGWIF